MEFFTVMDIKAIISHWWEERRRDAAAVPEPKSSSVEASGTINGFKFTAKEYDTSTAAALAKLNATITQAHKTIGKAQ